MTNETSQKNQALADELVEVTQADRDAVTAFHNAQLARIVAGDKTLGENRDCIEQAFARHRIAALRAPAQVEGEANRAPVVNAAEEVAEAAASFCSEMQEDGEGVPTLELAALHNALNTWEGLGPRRSMFDDSTPQTTALADLEVLERDAHATDRQRRIAARAIVAFSPLITAPCPTAAPDDEAVRLREALTPSGDTKAEYMGEFSFNVFHYDEDGSEVFNKAYVPWTTIKEIMKAISSRADCVRDHKEAAA